MNDWDGMMHKTREFILSNSSSVKTFHAINLRALAEMMKLVASPGTIIEEIHRGVSEMNEHLGILNSSSNEEELVEASRSIADIITRRPIVLRWLLVEFIREEEFERAEMLAQQARTLAQNALDRKGNGQESLWDQLEDTYSEEAALTADLELHLLLMTAIDETRK